MRVNLVLLCFVVVGCVTSSPDVGEARMSPSPNQPTLHSILLENVQRWSAEGKPATLDAERTKRFEEIASWLAAEVRSGDEAELLFVCTHNSRRSHMSQLWAQAAAYAKGLKVKTHSAGTETTAFNPRAVKALQSHGIKIVETGEVLGESNIVYEVGFGEGLPTVRNFSKKISHDSNPTESFGAVMVCSSADKSCPFVPGADLRVAIPYIDPKLSDGTDAETATYLAKSEEIGREMVWLMTRTAELIH